MSATGAVHIMTPCEIQARLVEWMRDEALALTHRRKAAHLLARTMFGRFGLLVDLSTADVSTLKAFARGQRPAAVH